MMAKRTGSFVSFALGLTGHAIETVQKNIIIMKIEHKKEIKIMFLTISFGFLV